MGQIFSPTPDNPALFLGRIIRPSEVDQRSSSRNSLIVFGLCSGFSDGGGEFLPPPDNPAYSQVRIIRSPEDDNARLDTTRRRGVEYLTDNPSLGRSFPRPDNPPQV